MELEQYKGYVTLNEGKDYRSISKELVNIGLNFKHATVRNLTEKSVKEYLDSFIDIAGMDAAAINTETVLNTVQFYDNLMEVIGKVTQEHPELLEQTLQEIKASNYTKTKAKQIDDKK
jgi:hypothetical protein